MTTDIRKHWCSIVAFFVVLMFVGFPTMASESIKYGPVTDAGQNIPSSGVIPNSTTLTECVMLMASSAILPTSNPPSRSIIDGTNFDYTVLAFDDTTDETAYWNFELPRNFTGTTAVVTTSWSVAACTADTADTVCWQINGGGFKESDVFKAGSLSGNATAGESSCATADDIEYGPDMVWTHGFDSTTGAKDTFAVFAINRDADLGASACVSAADISGDTRLLGVRVCYEVDNTASGENSTGGSVRWGTMEWGEDWG